MFDQVFEEFKLVVKELWVRWILYYQSNRRKILALTIVGSMLFVGLIIGLTRLLSSEEKGDIQLTVKVPALTRVEVRALKKYLNPYHVEVGKKLGLKKPFESQESFNDSRFSNVFSNDLDEVEDCDYYEVARSTHSIPYLVSDAKEVLDEVGERFSKRLESLGQKRYRLKINSLLRTLKDQKNLHRRNPTAAKTTSSHLYGRSFDIAESKFFEGSSKTPRYSSALRAIIIRELIAMQNEGKCYVILEDVTNCIHVTVR